MEPRIQAALAVAVQANVPVLVTGGAGIGKTSQLRYLASLKNWPVYEFNPSARAPEDLSIPTVNLEKGMAQMLPWEWALKLRDAEGPSLLILDEGNTGTAQMEAAMLRVILDRVVGETQLPNTRVVMLINPPELAPGGRELAGPSANRLCHLNARPVFKSWKQGQLTGVYPMSMPVLPLAWELQVPKAKAVVVSFLEKHSDLFYAQPREGDPQMSGAWPSPRTWDMAARLLAACLSIGLTVEDEVTQALVCGAVGEGAGGMFCVWAALLDGAPTPAEIWAAPRTVKLPERDDLITAVLNSLVSALAESIRIDSPKLAESHWQATWVALGRVASELGKKDLAVGGAVPLKAIAPDGFKMPPEAALLFDVLTTARKAIKDLGKH